MFRLLAAALVATFAVSANAAKQYMFSYSANVTGFEIFVDQSLPGCAGVITAGPSNCLNTRPWSGVIGGTAPVFSDDGTGMLMTPLGRAGFVIGGSADGALPFQGINFSYSSRPIGCCTGQNGTADTFSVWLQSINGAPPVPEPATWALMVTGFGAIGGALRVRRRRVVLAA